MSFVGAGASELLRETRHISYIAKAHPPPSLYSLARLHGDSCWQVKAARRSAQACRLASEWPGFEMDTLQDTVPLDKGGCCPALHRLVPVGFIAEARKLFVLSGPLVRRWRWEAGESGVYLLSGNDIGCAGGCSHRSPEMAMLIMSRLHQRLLLRAGDSRTAVLGQCQGWQWGLAMLSRNRCALLQKPTGRLG